MSTAESKTVYKSRVVLEKESDGTLQLETAGEFDVADKAEKAIDAYKPKKGFKLRADLSRVFADQRRAGDLAKAA